jgi:hypothetical protein
LHAFWNVIGAGFADQDRQRVFLEYMKSFLIMSQTHNGGMIIQPWTRDRGGANTDPGYGPRILPTATAAILLALPLKRLQITGAALAQETNTSTNAKPKRTSSPTKSAPIQSERNPKRKTRKLTSNEGVALKRLLRITLADLSANEELKPHPLRLSKARTRVWLKKAVIKGELTFRTQEGSEEASFQFDDLTAGDLVTLARLVTKLRPSDKDALAMTGFFMESVGRTEAADDYYQKAGSDSQEKIEFYSKANLQRLMSLKSRSKRALIRKRNSRNCSIEAIYLLMAIGTLLATAREAQEVMTKVECPLIPPEVRICPRMMK